MRAKFVALMVFTVISYTCLFLTRRYYGYYDDLDAHGFGNGDDDDDDVGFECREEGEDDGSSSNAIATMTPFDERILDCDFLEREDFWPEGGCGRKKNKNTKNNKNNKNKSKSKNKNKKNRRRAPPSIVIPLDPTTAKGPFIFLRVSSGVFNQFQMMWPVFILARELNATVLIGSGLSRESFLEDPPRYHPIPQSLLWDIAYIQQYWKMRGLEVYFSNFEPLLRKLLLPTKDEQEQQQQEEQQQQQQQQQQQHQGSSSKVVSGVLTDPLKTRQHAFRPAYNVFEKITGTMKEELWFGDRPWESEGKEIEVYRAQLFYLRHGIRQIQRPIYLSPEMRIRGFIEREINATITPDTIIFLPAEYTFGGYAVYPEEKKTRSLAREACLSIHISPRLLDIGCSVWSTLREQAGTALVVGVHLRIENDAQGWWGDFNMATHFYSQRITEAVNEKRKGEKNRKNPVLFGYLAYGELPPEREEQVISWADSFFVHWTTKAKVLDRINKRRERLLEREGNAEGREEADEQQQQQSKKPSMTEKRFNTMSNRTVPYEYSGYGEHITEIINANTMDPDEFDVEQEVDAMALVDAYVLTQCDLFLGHQLSSFSFTVAQWRTSKNLPSYYLNPQQPPPPPFFEAW